MIERPTRINRNGGMGVFSNGGMEDEDYIPALEEYTDAVEAERDRLRGALESITSDFDDWGDTIARYRMYEVASVALKEGHDD